MALSDEPRFAAAIACFKRRDFHAAHELWEMLWNEAQGPDRDFLAALVQIAAGFLKLASEQRAGAAKLFDRGSRRLEPFPARYAGLDVAALREMVEAVSRRCTA